MKKRLGCILAFCMALSLAACGGTDGGSGSTGGSSGSNVSQTPQASVENSGVENERSEEHTSELQSH